MKKLRNIMLVDDDDIANYIHSDLLMALGIADHITVVSDGKEAIEYLLRSKEPKHNQSFIFPDLIFLDINMPVMNGFDFLEAYNLNICSTWPSSYIIMLTTSMIEEEIDKAFDMHDLVKAYLEKPLTKEKALEVYSDHISNIA